MMDDDAYVFVIDDDASVRRSLSRLIRSAGWRVEAIASGQEFFERTLPAGPGCLVLDVRLPGLDGMEIQERLARAGVRIPIVFITGHGDIPMSVRAMKSGAVDFLPKPFEAESLLGAIARAIDRDRAFKREQEDSRVLRERFKRLTPREQQVLVRVVCGTLNKQVAAQLDITEKTVKVHRARVMAKMQAESLVELADMARRLGLNRTAEGPAVPG